MPEGWGGQRMVFALVKIIKSGSQAWLQRLMSDMDSK